jgi:glycosyltransferase involved in cell wall biosynthesis
MKVVQFLASKGWGGLEKAFVNLCNEMAKTTQIDVIIFDNSIVSSKFTKDVNVHLLYADPSRFNPFLYWELFRLLQKIEVDIVHTHSAKATQIFSYVNIFLSLPHVATKHNSRKGKIFNSLPNIIAVSDGVKESILHENVKVIYNGVIPVEVKPQAQNKVFTILAVGRLDKIKGFDLLIQECAKLDFPFRLDIVGEGEEKKNLVSFINKLHLEDQISLLGFREDIPQLMHNADVVVMSSHSEGFSLVMLEALFYAKLFISTKVSGATEVLDERFLFDGSNFSEKLKDIYKNESRYKDEYALLSKRLRDKFLLSHIAKIHIEYYESILERSGE